MDPKLQNRENPATALGLELLKGVDVPRVEHDRFLADRIGTDAQREATVCVVEKIGRADREVMHARVGVRPSELLEVAIESLKLLEKARVGEKAVENADRVAGINCGDEPVPGV